jgi:hypothetical protein
VRVHPIANQRDCSIGFGEGASPNGPNMLHSRSDMEQFLVTSYQKCRRLTETPYKCRNSLPRRSMRFIPDDLHFPSLHFPYYPVGRSDNNRGMMKIGQVDKRLDWNIAD